MVRQARNSELGSNSRDTVTLSQTGTVLHMASQVPLHCWPGSITLPALGFCTHTVQGLPSSTDIYSLCYLFSFFCRNHLLTYCHVVHPNLFFSFFFSSQPFQQERAVIHSPLHPWLPCTFPGSTAFKILSQNLHLDHTFLFLTNQILKKKKKKTAI